MKHGEKNIIFGLYDDEEDLKSAVRKANEDHLQIMDVLTPFPVHGLDPLLGLAESRIHIGGFVYGMLGTLTAFLGMTWIFTRLASDIWWEALLADSFLCTHHV